MPALLNAPLPRIFVRQQMMPLPRIDAMKTGERAVHLNETRMATVMSFMTTKLNLHSESLPLLAHFQHIRDGTGVVRWLVGGPVGSWITSSAGRIGNGAILRVSRESNTLDERETGRNGGERLRDCKEKGVEVEREGELAGTRGEDNAEGEG